MWQARQDARRSSRVRLRAPGAGGRYRLVFLDRLLVTLVALRHGVTHDVLAAWFEVDRSTVTRAIGEIRPILAERGCRIETGIRLRDLQEVVEYLGSTEDYAILDATEVRVRRPAAHAAGRDRFVSGKSRPNAIKSMVITDPVGRVLFCGATVPGSVADITQARDSGLVGLLAGGGARVLADVGYQGLNAETGGAVITPPVSQVPPQPARLVRTATPDTATGSLLSQDSCRAWHRSPEELACTRSPLDTPGGFRSHRPGYRRAAVRPSTPRPGSARKMTTEPLLRPVTALANHARGR